MRAICHDGAAPGRVARPLLRIRRQGMILYEVGSRLLICPTPAVRTHRATFAKMPHSSRHQDEATAADTSPLLVLASVVADCERAYFVDLCDRQRSSHQGAPPRPTLKGHKAQARRAASSPREWQAVNHTCTDTADLRAEHLPGLQRGARVREQAVVAPLRRLLRVRALGSPANAEQQMSSSGNEQDARKQPRQQACHRK